MPAADLFVWPAINEAFGMALLEAQACGTPVIAGASGGVPAIIADGETGWLSPPGDVAAFAADVDFALERELAPMRLADARPCAEIPRHGFGTQPPLRSARWAR